MESNTKNLSTPSSLSLTSARRSPDSGDFIEMFAHRFICYWGHWNQRGAVVECLFHREETNTLALWGLGDDYQAKLIVTEGDREASSLADGALQLDTVADLATSSLTRVSHAYGDELRGEEIEVIVPTVGSRGCDWFSAARTKSHRRSFTPEDIEVIRARSVISASAFTPIGYSVK